MHIGQRYTLKEFLYWNRRDVYWIILIATVITLLYSVGGLHGIAIPWVPVALVGTGAAFIVGFKNTQSYARLWEARQIWGAIINASRAFGMLIRDTTTADHAAVTQIFHRHFAWLTALRYQLRERKAWEYTQLSHYQDYLRHYAVPEWDEGLEKLLKEYLTGTDFSYIMKKRNKATQLIAIQSEHIKKLRAAGLISELNYVAIENMLVNLYDQQGKCERIKNTPYPRQFGSVDTYFVWLLIVILPLGLLNEFNKLGAGYVWLTIPCSTIVGWVFATMERIGQASENPFEGSPNDTPMFALSRTIEIDMRDMLDDPELPSAITATNNILM